LIYSTGLSTLSDIANVYDLANNSGVKLTLLHCNTSYPTPTSDVNLSRITELKSLFPTASVGYSDHTINHHACIGAVFLGATIIERHITLEKDIPNAQDWKVSSLPHELCELRSQLNHSYHLCGDHSISITPSSQQNISWALKSPYINTEVRKGDIISQSMFTMKRPYTGTSFQDIMPYLDSVPITADLSRNEPITHSLFKP
jgi:N-acetylneuraminate synthase/N,N'-diacetyllegionaminate synthase